MVDSEGGGAAAECVSANIEAVGSGGQGHFKESTEEAHVCKISFVLHNLLKGNYFAPRAICTENQVLLRLLFSIYWLAEN